MKEHLSEIISQILKELDVNETIEITKTKSKDNGDYSTNIAMKLSKKLKDNPMNIANKITEKIQDKDIIKTEVKQPGFINFFVKKDYLFENINKILEQKEKYGSSNIGNNKKINIEFVSANPTGILHLGNARGGAYGDSLARIMTFSGYDVTKEYYVNDAGNQINNLGLSIKARYLELNNQPSTMPEDGYFGKEIYEIAENLKGQYQDSKLNEDLEFFKSIGKEELIGRIIKDLENYGIHYDKLTSELDIANKYGLENIINMLKEKKVTYESDGALWFKCSEFLDDKDHVLIKVDGSYTYLVADIAYHIDKYQRGFDKMIDILGTDHHGYVARLKSSVKALGNDESKLDVKLLQLVRLIENNEIVKMSKRSGKSVTLNELIEEVGVNAARYYFSKNSLDTQMDFDLTLAKSKTNENPVYYVSYAYARICSIINNAKDVTEFKKIESLDNEYTYNVLEKVYEFPEVVNQAAIKELPHLITNYVYELASEFHLYYSKVRVINEDEAITNANIAVIKTVKQTIFNALNLIGVTPPEKM